ncbi:DUF4326 domain-containing protein [Amycolatopsis thermoflava]|uniref:DUF4326 domain-containing protein n=1 Tax=Amycolatopsis thermoflava TaxID=84480 RepID=UPI0003FCD499|nr:DUF4326 domain-containing protein [Amycolatopsis thermoflava]
MAEPKRIQRRRTRGWRMPEDAVYVGRPTKWGNPYDWTSYPASRTTTSIDGEPYIHRFDDNQRRHFAVSDFENGLLHGKWLTDYPSPEEIRRELAGKDLVCWCPLDQPCHGDVLLEIANAGEGL